MSRIYDTILTLRSDTTCKQFPAVLFSADTDMATAGWVSLTSFDKHEVVVAQLTADEYRMTAKDPSGYLQVEQRINSLLGRTDLKCPWFVGVEEVGSGGAGLSFQEFRKTYRPPIVLYRDIFRADSVAREVSRTSLSQFERDGGKLLVVQ